MTDTTRRDFLKILGLGVATLFTPKIALAKMIVGPNGQLIYSKGGKVYVHESKNNPKLNGKWVKPEVVGLKPEEIERPEDRFHPLYQGEEIQEKDKTSLTKILNKLNNENVGIDQIGIYTDRYRISKNNDLKQSNFERWQLFEIASKYPNHKIGRINMTIDFANHYQIPRDHIPRIIALFEQESGYNPSAKAKTSTATGITQILAGTAREYGISIKKSRVQGYDDRLVDSVSIDGGIRIIKDYVQQIRKMYQSLNQAYDVLDGVYYTGTGAWQEKRYPKGTKQHRVAVTNKIPNAIKVLNRQQMLRTENERQKPKFYI